MEKKVDAYHIVITIAKIMVKVTLLLFVCFFFYSLLYKSTRDEWVSVTHPEYGFSYSYPTKWKNEFFGESGHRGFEETKALLRNNPFLGPGIAVLVVSYDNLIADNIEDWNRINWGGEAVLVEENIAEKKAWRAQRFYENNALRELIYFAREDDFIVIMIDGYEQDIDHMREDIERFLVSFEPFPK